MRQKFTTNIKWFFMKMSEENPYKQKWSNWYMLQICGANFVLHDVIVLVYANMFTLWNLCHKILLYYAWSSNLQFIMILFFHHFLFISTLVSNKSINCSYLKFINLERQNNNNTIQLGYMWLLELYIFLLVYF
jgi:hypothetical protein